MKSFNPLNPFHQGSDSTPMSTIFDIHSANLLNVGQVHADAGWQFPSHSHAYWEFIYYLRGGGRVDFPTASLHPRQHYLLIYPPGLAHAEATDPVELEETIFFSIDVPGNPPAGAHLLVPDPHGEMRWLCMQILREQNEYGVTPLAQTYARAFLYLVERAWEHGIPVQHDAVDFAAQYLYANYAGDISLSALAEVVRLSPTHLAHLFTARLGISPIRYLRRIRLEHARRLLETTELTVNEIAARTGFTDPLYFRRMFKQATGSTPTAMRRQVEQQESP